MKNAIKIQNDIMKYIKKYNERREKRNAMYSVTTINGMDKIIVTTDTYIAYCFDIRGFYLDTSKMNEMNGLRAFVAENELKKQVQIYPSSIIKKCKNGNAVELVYKTFKVYVNEKFINEFGKAENLTFYGSGERKPVYVYEAGELVGLIMPISPARLK